MGERRNQKIPCVGLTLEVLGWRDGSAVKRIGCFSKDLDRSQGIAWKAPQKPGRQSHTVTQVLAKFTT